ncbi:MAG TPA: dihydrofolate reductase family protein [Jiangellaceae bacterium]|nr:dihydrofolate reductase family protein [Jiangellaceae bacterium]
MRKLVVSNVMSLDGYVDSGASCGPELPIRSEAAADAFNAYNAERLRAASTLLAGQTSFEMFEGYWPAAEHDENVDDVQREISHLNNRVDKTVVSDTYEIAADSPWAASTRVVPRDQAADVIAKAKQGEGQDILIFGSATTWNALLGAGIVDELHLMVTPVVFGSGVPAFKSRLDDELRLLDIRRFEEADTAVLRFAVHDGVE